MTHGWLLLGLLLGASSPPLRSEIVSEGPVEKRVSTAPADLVVFYGGEQKGQLDTCGCSTKPKGSVSRLAKYVAVSRAASPAPSVVVNPGQWLDDPGGFDGLLRPEAVEANRWMVRGLELLGADAYNVTPPDVAAFSALDSSVRRLPLVSANISGPGIAKWRVIERGGVRVGITGIAAAEPTLAQTPGYTVAAPETAVETVRALAAQVDVVVLLAWHAPEAAKAVVRAVPQVDVVVDGNRHKDHSEPFLVGDAVWAWSFLEAQRLGELRLDLDGGRVVGVLDRKIDLDPSVAEDKAIAELAKQAAAAVDAATR